MLEFKVDTCERNNPCVDCDNSRCIFQGKKESDCPKWKCDRPDGQKYDCDHCEFIDKFIEQMRDTKNEK